MARQQKKLGEILMEWGVVKEKELGTALKHAKTKNMRIGEALVDLKVCNEANVYKALAAQHNLEFIEVDKTSVPENLAKAIPADLMRKYLILPVGGSGNRLKVAIHDPLDIEMQDILRFKLGKDIRPVLAAKGQIKKVLDDMLGTSAQNTIDKTMDKSMDRTIDKSLDRSLDRSVDKSVDSSIDVQMIGEDIGADPSQAPIIKLVQAMIAEACRSRASDIHIEPMADRVRIRYRIDGECVVRDDVPSRMKAPLISRLKIMAGIDIAEKRLPQDGRIKLIVDGSQVDFRVSSLPAYHGESVVLRILRPDSVKLGLESMGFEAEDYKRFQDIIKKPNGIFLVTGPTGSGKTTTLYAALNVLNRPDKKIITAEDPVEYNFVGINQCQIRDTIGLSFGKILRAMLRQAPNIILVGEIRDLEVAEVAIQAALTGHLVFSTLHTNDAPSAITRLIDMGVKPFLVASAIQAVMGQRLVRKLCPNCKVPDETPDPKMMSIAGFKPGDTDGRTVYRPVGCEQCSNTGFRGRVAIFEMMVMTNELRTLAFERAPTNKLRQSAIAGGMKNLLGDGRIKVLNGITTAEEIVKVAQIEGVLQNAD